MIKSKVFKHQIKIYKNYWFVKIKQILKLNVFVLIMFCIKVNLAVL